MSINRTRLAVLSLCFVLSACAVGEAMQADMRERLQEYPSVREWACEPGRAQLVIDATGSTPAGGFTIETAVIESSGAPTSAVHAGAVSAVGVFNSWKRVVLFANLSPGVYKVRRLRLSNLNGWLAAPVPDSDDFTVTLEPNKLFYLGRIVLEQKFGSPTRTIRLSPDGESRSAAFAILKERFPTSACVAMLPA
jgi:hypothetical protein